MSSHTATINPGIYTPNIGTTTISVFCNDNEGFAIFAAGYTGEVVGDANSNKLVGTNNNTITIPTGILTSGDSQWAMKLSTDSEATYPITIDSAPNTSGGADASFSSYHVVPNEYTKVAHRNSNTDVGTNAIGSELTTTYAVNISSSQVADTYTGKVIYTMVHPANHAAPVACRPSGTTISTIACMQDITSSNKSTVMASMTEGTQYTLKDKRDGKEYKVAKLADGKVWMTQNLDLDLDSSVTYTNLDTDLGWNTSTNSYQTASWSPSRSTYATATNNIHEWCQGGTWNSEYNYCENNNSPESYDPGNLYWNTTTSNYTDWDDYNSSCDYSTSPPSCDESLNPLSTYVSSTGTAQYHIGNYYNWVAAIASNDSSVYDGDDLVEQSICPAGWTLPYASYNDSTYQSEGDFVDLWTEYGSDSASFEFSDITDLTGAPLYFAPTGNFFGNLGDVGSSGSFWSSVASNANYAVDAGFGVDGRAYPANYYFRAVGCSLRCLLR